MLGLAVDTLEQCSAGLGTNEKHGESLFQFTVDYMACASWICPCWASSVQPQEEPKATPARRGSNASGERRASANGQGEDLLFKKPVKLVSNNTSGSPAIQPRVASPEKTEPKKTTTKPTSTRGLGSAITAGLAALWNALEKGDENEFLDQSAVIERALPALRAGSKSGPDVTSAMSLGTYASLSSQPARQIKREYQL